MSEDGLTGMKLVWLGRTKEWFVGLCRQYDRMGCLMKLQARAISHPLFANSTIRDTAATILEQYQEMGEQLKLIGEGLDAVGKEDVFDGKGLGEEK